MSLGLMVADLVIWSSWLGLQDDRWTQFILYPPFGASRIGEWPYCTAFLTLRNFSITRPQG